MLETVIGWTCLIVGATGLLIKNINWRWEGFDKFKKKGHK